MAATEIIKRTYAPSGLVGKIYAAPYGSGTALVPIGNVLEAATEQSENVEKQDDMTQLGGGTHAEIRRVTGVKFSAKVLQAVDYITVDPTDWTAEKKTNELVRQYQPKGSDLSGYSQEQLDAIADQINNPPWKG